MRLSEKELRRPVVPDWELRYREEMKRKRLYSKSKPQLVRALL